MRNYSITNDDLILTVTELGASVIGLSTIEKQFPILRSVELTPNFNAGQSAMYPLLPFANRIKNNNFLWESKLITWPKHQFDDFFFLHGNGWLEHWNKTKQTDQQLTFELHSSIEDICSYQAIINYQLIKKSLLVELSITNKGAGIFPFGLGFHPFFTTLENSEIQFNATGIWLEDDDHLPDQYISPIPEQFSCNKSRKIPEIWINNGYISWQGSAILQHENGLKVTISSDCPVLQVFKFADQSMVNPQDRFICLEPQSHGVNDHNNLNYGLLRLLEPEQATKIWMKIEIA